MANVADLTVQITVERLPVWRWPISVPRNVFKRYRWLHSYGRPKWKALLVAAYLGTRRIRVGKFEI